MKTPTFKMIALAFLANLVPFATGAVQIALGNLITGIGAIAGGLSAAAIQVVNAQAEALQTRSFFTATWFFSRLYVWMAIVVGIIVSFILFGKPL